MADDVFDTGWLALREPVDHRSRSHALVDALVRETGPRPPAEAVDLGGGTGSNIRYLAPRIPGVNRWTVVDHDPVLLSSIETPPGTRLRTVTGDLRREGLEAAAAADLVTASALLDLVTRSWLEDLARRCAARGTPLLLALSYDGRVSWRAPAPGGGPPPASAETGVETEEDRFVARAVNRHQAGPKGMGAALGPEAWRVAAGILESAGYRVRVEASPWVLEPTVDGPLVQALVEGWVEAAVEVHPAEARRIRAWAAGRTADFRAGAVALEVGHRDLLALWPGGEDFE